MAGVVRRGALVASLVILAVLATATVAGARPLADSVILLIGDGMGPVQIEMARGAAGRERLTMEQMPYSGTMTTDSAERRTTDSAAAGTALATGHKTNNGMISVLPDGTPVETILERCLRAQKSTGIITTDALHGATPAAFASHVSDRGMRSEVTQQLAESRAQVMMGFWRTYFLPESAGGRRTDGRNLIDELRSNGYQVVLTREELAAASEQAVVGLFPDGPHAPTLAEMVRAALSRLGTDTDGFFLVVEGARIDWACHGHDPAGSVRDTLELDEAVAAALDFARQRGRVLVVATADHETGGLRIETPGRLESLRGVSASAEQIAGHLSADRSNIGSVMAQYAGLDGLSAAETDQIRAAEDAEAAVAAVLSERAGVTWSTRGHTSTPVRVFSFGPGADRFTGEISNIDIPRRIADILGLGPFPE